MFTAHFDASYNKNATAMVGFVSTIEQWELFEKEWRSILPKGIEMFHMTDFVSSQAGWEAWKGKSLRRAKLIDRLVSCIRKHTRQGFAVTVMAKDYKDVNTYWTLKETVDSQYGFVGTACFGSLKLWAKKKHIDLRRMLCLIEKGDPKQSWLIDRLREDGFNVEARPKEQIRAFDACDLAAWKARVICDDGFRREEYRKDPGAVDRIMKSLDQLEGIVHSNATMGFINLKKTCLLLGGKRRPVVP